MECFTFQNVTFTYPEQEKPALCNVSFSINEGAFLVLCGPSGCGKSTLLRHLKTCLTPHGTGSGVILYQGKTLSGVDTRTQAKEIGFVFQSPENQVVTDKVWHELAFGLESLGLDMQTIRRKVAEIAAYFGMEQWFYSDVAELSGGQKQMLSLASVMAMQPKVLVLDEPTAQLDPIAASEFLEMLAKINRELGTTIILTEHRLEEVFPYATNVMVMEQGKILCEGKPEDVGIQLKDRGCGMFLAMPTPMRVWAALSTNLPCPMTVRDGSEFLTARNLEVPLLPLKEKPSCLYGEEVILQADELFFRYEKEAPDVVKGFSLKLKRGEFYAILGGNGAGKSTTLKTIAGLLTPDRGMVRLQGRVAYLPQNPQSLFAKRTVREDLYEVFQGNHISKEEQEKRVAWVVQICGLTGFLDRHPFDISGGEQQRSALAKILLTSPDVLLLDEPTKGFDAEFKVTFAGILKRLLQQGVTILMVSHDVTFCAEYAHHCGLFFDGTMVAHGEPRTFFSGNSFYTTAANRMARHLIPQAVTVKDVIGCCGGEIPYEEELDEQIPSLPRLSERSVNFRPSPLPLWRKGLAAISAVIAVLIFFYATSIIDLSKYITASGVTDYARGQLGLCVALLLDLLIFISAIGRRSAPPVLAQTSWEKRKLSKRTKVALFLILGCIPLTIFTGVVYLGDRHYHLVAFTVLLECMVPFALIFEGRRPKVRELVVIAVLCAIAVASRTAFFMLPQFKPVLALVVIAGVAFGGETGFLVGAVTMLVSNILFSQGPWTPWQMFSMGIIGFWAGILFRKGWLRRNRISLAIFGAMSAIFIYGGIMNFASALMISPTSLDLSTVLAYYVSGFPMDLIHALATVVVMLLVSEPMLEKLDRIKVKYGLTEPNKSGEIP